jgi:hypothetical protein
LEIFPRRMKHLPQDWKDSLICFCD